MSSPSSYTLVDRVDDGNLPNRRRESVTRLSSVGANATSIRCSSPTVHSNDEHTLTPQNEISFNPDNFVLVFLDLHSQLNANPISSLRLIINEIHTFIDIQTCLKFVRFCSDRIFFVLTSNDKQVLEEFHSIKSIEAIFIFNIDAQLDSRFPKLYGVYSHYEQVLNGIKDTLDWYEQVQLEIFVFERDRVFLWIQLWRDEFLKTQKSQISSSTKETLVQLADSYYRGNTKMNSLIKEFDQTYTKSDVLQWCFSSIFPSYFVHHSLRCLNAEHLQACRFLLLDTTRVMQLSQKKSSCELYKGMKMTNDYLTKLENSIDRLICPKGYLQCTLSRKVALDQANSPDHRTDLMSVLIKITYDASVSLVTLSKKNHMSTMLFDAYTVFRIKYVKRGQLTTIKIELADDIGKKLAREYRIEHEPQTVQNLLNQLLTPPKLPVRLPPLVPRSQRSLSVLSDLSPNEVSLSVIPETDDDEAQAQEFVKNGQIDEAIEAYQHIKPDSARIFNTIGVLLGDKKGDYESAIVYYKKALKIQEKNGEYVTATLSQIGNAHQNRREFDLALACHTRALAKRKKTSNIDAVLIAASLIGVANAHWGQRNFTEALKIAQQALTLNESIERGNDLNIASNLAILANIYHTSGNTHQALEMATRGLGILERLVPDDSPALAAILNNVATMQVAVGLLSDARKSFDRALDICKKSLPEGHPKRIAMENNIQRIIEMERIQQEQEDNSNL